MADSSLDARVAAACEHLVKEYAELPAPTCTALPVRTISLRQADGATLLTNIQLPDGAGPFPVIVQRTPYPHNEPLTRIHAEAYASRGFGFVWQYCRGTGGSTGKWSPNVNERSDGLAALDWLASQDWCDSIGWYGSSYLALTGWAVADALPEKVKCLYLSHYGTDRHTSAYSGGAFRHDVLTGWAMENAGHPVEADYLSSCLYRPHIEVDEALWGGRLDWYRDWVSHPNASDDYWNRGFWAWLKNIPPQLDRPLCLVEGWFDHHLESALASWEKLPPATKAQSQLHIGPWNHFFEPAVTGSPKQELGDSQRAFSWFSQLLKQNEPPKPVVSYFEIGSEQWKTATHFPFQPDSTTVFFFSSAKSDIKRAFTLTEVPDDGGEISYLYDPGDPVPSHGAESMLMSHEEIGSLPQPEPGYREDVISFISSPLSKPLHILGKICARLWVSSSANDTAFTVKICEVLPDGLTRNIRSAISSISSSLEGSTEPTYVAGTPICLEIETWNIAWQLAAGSRLRIDISSSDFPQYSIHTNTEGLWSEQEDTVVARQSIYCGAPERSYVSLPTVEEPGSHSRKGN